MNSTVALFLCLFHASKSEFPLKEIKAIVAPPLERQFILHPKVIEDTCFYNNVLLKIDINKHYQVTDIYLSDNAHPWMKIELEKLKERGSLNHKQLEKA